MRLRTISLAGIGTAALVFALLPVGSANASRTDASRVSMSASGVGSHGKVAPSSTAKVSTGKIATAKCGTGFGPELPTPDGLIAWNDGGSFDTAGGADVVCTSRTRINKVSAYGYFGAATETFHVTFYKNSPTNGSNEPNDAAVKCDYPALTGAAGGQYPTHALTVLTLTSPCRLRAHTYWVSIQNVDASGPWYWEMQDSLGGNTVADWVDRTDAFGSGCTTFDNDRYLVDCLGYTYPDFMLKLS